LVSPRVKALGRLIAKGLEDRIIFAADVERSLQTDPPENPFSYHFMTSENVSL